MKRFLSTIIIFGIFFLSNPINIFAQEKDCTGSLSGLTFSSEHSLVRDKDNRSISSSVTTQKANLCQGQTVPDANKDFTFEFRPKGSNINWVEVKIPDSSVPIKYNDGKTTKLTAGLKGDRRTDIIYEGRFKEESKTPDSSGPLLEFWFDEIAPTLLSVVEGSLTNNSVTITGSTIFTNDAAQKAGKEVPGRQIVGILHEGNSEKNTYIKEISLTNSAKIKYGQNLKFNIPISGLKSNTFYYLVVKDKMRNQEITSHTFKTTNGNTTSTNVQNTSSSSNSGNSSSQGNTGSSNQSSNNQSKDLLNETVSSARGIKVLYGISKLDVNTAQLYNNSGNSESILSIAGSIAYDDLPATLPKLGTVSLDVYDKNGRIGSLPNTTGQDLIMDNVEPGARQKWGFTYSIAVNPNNAPFSVRVNEKDLGLSSRIFTQQDLLDAQRNAQNSNKNETEDNSSGGSGVRGTFRNPLPPELQTIPGIVNVLVKNIVIPIAIPLLGMAIMYTGFLFVRARGNPEKIKEAKEALKYTLIGGAIILGAYVIAEALQATIQDMFDKLYENK